MKKCRLQKNIDFQGKTMRLHIIPLTLLILLTGCGAKDKKLIEMESELVQDQGTSQICVYNDVFTAKGKKVIIPLLIS